MNDYEKQYSEETFSQYTEIDFPEMKEFNIIHLYNTDVDCYPDGFHDAKWLEVVCFNSVKKQKAKLLRQQDALMLRSSEINSIRYFVDNSICITFNGMHRFNGIFQASDIEKI